ncbi:MAG: hypothetical protein K2W96_09105 [Gemmataceae bacterium]|nr:hypothetical protein [Gemmataceae bacterium]
MSLRIACPGCKQPLECRPEHAGMAVACPECGQRMRVPGVPVAVPVPPMELPAPPPPPLPPPPRDPVEEREPRPRLNTSGEDNPFALGDDGDILRAGASRLQPRLPASVSRDLVGEPVREFEQAGSTWMLLAGAGGIVAGLLLFALAVFGGGRVAGRPSWSSSWAARGSCRG